jgi:dihydropteroate synthase
MEWNRFFETPKIMAIVNCTPDSFFEKSRSNEENIVAQCQKHLEEGADILDLGAYSTRPNATEVSEKQELERLIPLLKIVRKEFPKTPISVDTFRKNVAETAVKNGANLINDVSGATLDDEMFPFICESKTPYILMHTRGNPQNMMDFCDYKNLTLEIINEVKQKIETLQKNEIPCVFDPGFGFAKNLNQNYQLLNQLNDFQVLNCPVLVGVSRKSMIWKLLDSSPEKALNGTSILHSIALSKGAKILRVHDVQEAKECLKIHQKLNEIF